MLSTFAAVRFALGWGLLMQAPDAGSGGGGTDPAGAGAGSTPAAVVSAGSEGAIESDAAGAHAGGEDALEDELLADEGNDGVQRSPDEQMKAMRDALKKWKKRALRESTAAQRFKGHDLDQLLADSRQFKAVNDAIARLSPKQRAILFGGEALAEEPPAAAARPAAEPEDPEFDETSLPFDPNENEVNQYFATLARQNHDLQRTIKRLEGRLNDRDSRETARSEATIRTEWKGAIDAAAATITDDGVRTLFKDSMASAYRDRGSHKKNPQQMVEWYLSKLPLTLKQQQKAADAASAAQVKPAAATGGRPTAATAQRLAEQNKQLPKTVAPSGQPAPAKVERPSLADIRKKLGGGRRG